MGLKKLYIDLDKCLDCSEDKCSCSYNFHPENNGIETLREMASFAVICRKCEQGTCVLSCTKEALEKMAAMQQQLGVASPKGQGDGVLKRYNMRCIGCKSCTLACPFGTIIPEFIPYKVSNCDFCIGRLNAAQAGPQRGSGNEIPVCVTSCPINAIKYGEFEADESKGEYNIGEYLIAKAYAWDKVSKRIPEQAVKR